MKYNEVIKIYLNKEGGKSWERENVLASISVIPARKVSLLERQMLNISDSLGSVSSVVTSESFCPWGLFAIKWNWEEKLIITDSQTTREKWAQTQTAHTEEHVAGFPGPLQSKPGFWWSRPCKQLNRTRKDLRGWLVGLNVETTLRIRFGILWEWMQGFCSHMNLNSF